MSTPPDDHEPSVPFTPEELAKLQAGLLTTEEEKDLRMRMEKDPDAANDILARLEAVDRMFPEPPNVEAPLSVPPHVAARWQLAIAREAERRALGYPSEADGNATDTFVDEPSTGAEDTRRDPES